MNEQEIKPLTYKHASLEIHVVMLTAAGQAHCRASRYWKLVR